MCDKITMVAEYVERENKMPDPLTRDALSQPVKRVELEHLMRAAEAG